MERENASKEHAQKFTLWVPIKGMSLKGTWVRSTYWFWWASRIGRVAAGDWKDGISHLVFCFIILTPALASLLVVPLAYWRPAAARPEDAQPGVWGDCPHPPESKEATWTGHLSQLGLEQTFTTSASIVFGPNTTDGSCNPHRRHTYII